MSVSSAFSEYVDNVFPSPPSSSPGTVDFGVQRRKTFENRVTSYSRGNVVQAFLEYEVYNVVAELSQTWMFGECPSVTQKISEFNKVRMNSMMKIYGDKNGRVLYVHSNNTCSENVDDFGCTKIQISPTGRLLRCEGCGEIKRKKDICQHVGFALLKLEENGLNHIVGRTLSDLGCGNDELLFFPSLARRKLCYPTECNSDSSMPRSASSSGEPMNVVKKYFNKAEVTWNLCFKEAFVEHAECGKPRTDVKVTFVEGMFQCTSDSCSEKADSGQLCFHLKQTLLCAVKHSICKEQVRATLDHYDSDEQKRVQVLEDYPIIIITLDEDEETLISYGKGILTCRHPVCQGKKDLPTRMCGHIRVTITYLLLRSQLAEVVEKTVEHWEVLHMSFYAHARDPLDILLEDSETSNSEDCFSDVDEEKSSCCEDSFGVLVCDHLPFEKFKNYA